MTTENSALSRAVEGAKNVVRSCRTPIDVMQSALLCLPETQRSYVGAPREYAKRTGRSLSSLQHRGVQRSLAPSGAAGQHALGPRVQGTHPLLGEIVALVDGGEKLVDGDGVEAPVLVEN